MSQCELDGLQFHVGETQVAQGRVVDAGRAHQGATAEQAALGVLDVAAGAGDGACQRRAQAPLGLPVLGLEQVGRAEGGGAEAQFKLRIADKQVDGGVATTAAFQGLGLLTPRDGCVHDLVGDGVPLRAGAEQGGEFDRGGAGRSRNPRADRGG
ncbi:hypothetical protein D3C85_871360 [compost metagenome]